MAVDANFLYDNADVVWYGTDTYANAIGALQEVSGKSEQSLDIILRGKYGVADYWSAVEELKSYGVVAAKNSNGYNCFAYQDSLMTSMPTGPMFETDSNAMATTQVKAAPAYNVTVDDVQGSPTEGKVVTDKVGSDLPSSHTYAGWEYYAANCLQAVSAVGAGISLGKVIDSTLYNANPDFWDSNGMSSLNPETWASITNGDDSIGAGLFNTIFGINPNTGQGQMFIDENALAYLALYMKEKGAFNRGSVNRTHPASGNFNPFFSSTTQMTSETYYTSQGNPTKGCPIFSMDNQGFGYAIIGITGNPTYNISVIRTKYTRYNPNIYVWDVVYASSDSSFTVGYQVKINMVTRKIVTTASHGSRKSYTKNGQTVYYYSDTAYDGNSTNPAACEPVGVGQTENTAYQSVGSLDEIAWQMVYGSYTEVVTPAVQGISDQPNATQPDVSSWSDVPSTLSSLQNQYPSMWDDSVPNTIVQPDGSVKTITYVPIAMPQSNGQWDSQPVSSTTSQANPMVEPETQPTTEGTDLLKLLLQLITQPEPQPDSETQPETQPQPVPEIPTPTDTGTGSSPIPSAPDGSATALWSVYHPTKAQIDSFGAWLWGSPFLTNIGKLFQNPIEGVISLHKIFATPVDAGIQNIVVGTLDSGVSSQTVTQQYVTVDCGYVDCYEQFGSVFDYPPHTFVSLYLPFIGIVPLDTDDVMRSTIHILYGVDVFTGACLARVEVKRDGNTVNLYQYSGCASVEYPLSNIQHSQLINAIIGVGGAIGTIAATGGAMTPMVAAGTAIGAASGLAAGGKTNVGRSGGFSGNAGAMGIKKPYLIIQRPQTKIAATFPRLDGYPNNISVRLGDCSNHVKCKTVHVNGINATRSELEQIEMLLKEGVEI